MQIAAFSANVTKLAFWDAFTYKGIFRDTALAAEDVKHL